MLNLQQADCRHGGVAFAAGEDLSLKAGCLVRLNAGGDLVLPGAATELTPYVVTQGADQGYLCGAVPLTSAGNCRVRLSGSCVPGDLLVATGDGRVEVGTLSGGALPVGTAEEVGVNGQHVLLRPLAVGATGADGADGAAGADGADGLVGRDGGVLTVPYANISGLDKPALADSLGLIVWLAVTDGYGWYATWDSWGGYFLQGVVVGVDAAAGTVSVMLFAATDTGVTTQNGVYPRSIPAGCVRSGTAGAVSYLGAVSMPAGYCVLGAADGSSGFVGNSYLDVLVVDGGYLTCGWGGTLSFGG